MFLTADGLSLGLAILAGVSGCTLVVSVLVSFVRPFPRPATKVSGAGPSRPLVIPCRTPHRV